MPIFVRNYMIVRSSIPTVNSPIMNLVVTLPLIANCVESMTLAKMEYVHSTSVVLVSVPVSVINDLPPQYCHWGSVIKMFPVCSTGTQSPLTHSSRNMATSFKL